MVPFTIVAHRGFTEGAPENTLLAYQKAIEMGADAVEMDVRLTSDHVPVIYHYYYLEELTPLKGPIFNYSADQLKQTCIIDQHCPEVSEPIPTLREVLESIGGRIGLEIELKGPEPECAGLVAAVLKDYPQYWNDIEVTSFQPALLFQFREVCPGLSTDLLLPRSESWMKPDVIAYQAVHLARQAGTGTVHLHCSQLDENSISYIRGMGLEIHTWDVNDLEALNLSMQYKIPRICTDRFRMALGFRDQLN